MSGDRLWGRTDFGTRSTISENWFARTYLALDETPIVVMIENGRTGAIWRAFMANPEMRPALDKIAPRGVGTPDNSPTAGSGIAGADTVNVPLPSASNGVGGVASMQGRIAFLHQK